MLSHRHIYTMQSRRLLHFVVYFRCLMYQVNLNETALCFPYHNVNIDLFVLQILFL
jgi:hypothetical protein